VKADTPLLEVLVAVGLAGSNTEARRFVAEGAVSVNNEKISADKKSLLAEDFHDGVAVLRRGKNALAIAALA
jgi:tyrosyl-tRNA synthetase